MDAVHQGMPQRHKVMNIVVTGDLHKMGPTGWTIGSGGRRKTYCSLSAVSGRTFYRLGYICGCNGSGLMLVRSSL